LRGVEVDAEGPECACAELIVAGIIVEATNDV
jgi:hypothetical protein